MPRLLRKEDPRGAEIFWRRRNISTPILVYGKDSLFFKTIWEVGNAKWIEDSINVEPVYYGDKYCWGVPCIYLLDIIKTILEKWRRIYFFDPYDKKREYISIWREFSVTPGGTKSWDNWEYSYWIITESKPSAPVNIPSITLNEGHSYIAHSIGGPSEIQGSWILQGYNGKRILEITSGPLKGEKLLLPEERDSMLFW